MSLVSPTLFLININDLLLVTTNHIHGIVDDSKLHSSLPFDKPASVIEQNFNRKAVAGTLSRDREIITDWELNGQ